MKDDEIAAARELGTVAVGRHDLEVHAEQRSQGIEPTAIGGDQQYLGLAAASPRDRRLVVERQRVVRVDAGDQLARRSHVGGDACRLVRGKLERAPLDHRAALRFLDA